MTRNIKYLNWTFPPDKIREGNLYLVTSLLSSALEVNTLFAAVECSDPSILDFARNAPLLYFTRPDLPMIFRVQNIKRVGPGIYEISATSTLGLLTEGLHYGGIYTGQTAQEVVSSICGTVPFIIKNNLAGTKLYGWLPIAAPRDNLSQVLFAIGAALKTDLDGVLRIAGLWDGVSGTVGRDELYQEARAEYSAKVTQVLLTEHQYAEGAETAKLFEGTAQEGDIITFTEPMHSLTAEGITVLESGANYAKVSAGSGTLTGKKYIYNTRLISRNVQTANAPNVKTVDKATLVSLVNSAAVADRLAAFYKCTQTIDAPVVYSGENPGDVLSVYHPYDKSAVSSCLQSADITLSGTLKAQEKSLVGYVPENSEKYELSVESVILSGIGTFVVPDGVNELEIVVIGAGGAGTDGKSGESRGSADSKRNSKSAELYGHGSVSINDVYSSTGAGSPSVGGDGGISGTPGKVLEAKINVTSGTEINYQCGVGGTEQGEIGGETTFGEYSSANGSIYQNGYFDVISNKSYAVRGYDGVKGGDGGAYDSKGEDVSGAIGGNPVTPTAVSDSAYEGGYFGSTSVSAKGYTGRCGGGGAGGSSGDVLGANGGNAFQRANAFSFTVNAAGTSYVTVYGGTSGSGGNGANGKNGETYGSSGSGGGGGGGSGAYGVVEGQASARFVSDYGSSNTSETIYLYVTAYRYLYSNQGSGGAHGNGADGCVIVRYRIKKKIESGQLVDKNNRMVLDRLGRRIIV